MKTTSALVIAIMLLTACSSPKKTPTRDDVPKASRTDVLRGGTSFSNAIVIMVENESAGLNEEYKWLANNYPGYSLVRRNSVKKSSKHYDIIRIKTQGQVKDIYFDSTHFWGKN